MQRLSQRLSMALRGCLLALAALTLLAAPAHASRLALVIGNAAYTDGPLKNPVNDARAMDQKLASLGFRVQRIENLKRTQIGRTITAFASTVRAGDDVVVFYAGHGVQVKGVNYLPAVDADIQSEEDVPLNSLNLNNLMDRLDEAKAGLKILFLDACRNNPYARSFRSADRGLARVGAAPSGTLIHFATRPGSVAADGGGANGLYTSELLRHLDSPNVPIEAMLKRVSAAVETASKGTQEPWTEGSIRGEFYFRGTGAGAGVQLASARAEPTGRPAQGDPEEDAWASTKAANTAAAYDAYLNEYPKGRYASAARIGKVAVQGQSSPQPTAQQAVQPRPASTSTYTPGQVFKDCTDCPEMVVIPAGSFEMGGSGSDEKPVHRVNFRGLAVGKTHVTQGQWQAVMGGNPSKFTPCGQDCPVEQVNWSDAQAFIQKLNHMTGAQYRLPSEAEWEYACRAGGRDEYCGGDNVDAVGWYIANSGETTHPVAQKQANAFGLYDMSGNVYQWVEDCFHDNYSGAPADGGAWTTGCSGNYRVLRGGSWINNSAVLRSANRNLNTPDFREYYVGFRLARALLTP